MTRWQRRARFLIAIAAIGFAIVVASTFKRRVPPQAGVGLTYDKNRDLLTIDDRVAVEMAPDGAGGGALHINAGTAVFDRGAKTIQFERTLKAVRDTETVEADTGTAHLTADEQKLELL